MAHLIWVDDALLDEIKRWFELTAATSGATALVIADRLRWQRRRLDEVAVPIQINSGHATIVEDYRIRSDVDPEALTVEHPFRPEPENGGQRRHWHAALLAVETHLSLAGEDTATSRCFRKPEKLPASEMLGRLVPGWYKTWHENTSRS